LWGELITPLQLTFIREMENAMTIDPETGEVGEPEVPVEEEEEDEEEEEEDEGTLISDVEEDEEEVTE
jgi:hypothetical protein